MQAVFTNKRALYERDSVETDPVNALEDMFNSNLESRALDSKFAAIYERLKANEALWADYVPGKEYRLIARLTISRSKRYSQGAEGYYYLLRSKCAGASKDFWMVALQSYPKNTWHRYFRHVYPCSCTQKTLDTCFLHAIYLEDDGRYIIKEVSGIGNDYVTIKRR